MRGYIRKCYLYKLIFPNGMVYIGTAYDIRARWANDGVGYRGQSVSQAIAEFGWDNIEKEVLLHLPESAENTDSIRRLERELIHAYGDRAYNRQCNKRFHREAYEAHRESYPCKVFWTIDGVTKPAKEWCAERGVLYGRIKRTIERHAISPEQALSLPPVPRNMSLRAVEYWQSQGFDYFN